MSTPTPFDPYVVLGIERNATSAQIKAAYRRLAKSLHPDQAGPGHEQMFAAVTEAYDILSNPERKAKFDTTGVVDNNIQTIRQDTLTALASIFDEVLNGLTQPIDSVDLLALMVTRVEEKKEAAHKINQNMRSVVEAFERLLKKFRSKAEENAFEKIIKAKIQANITAITSNETIIDRLERLQTELSLYETIEQFATMYVYSTASTNAPSATYVNPAFWKANV